VRCRKRMNWRTGLENCGHPGTLEAAAYEVAAVPDETTSTQALARIRKILETLPELDARIAALGKVIN